MNRRSTINSVQGPSGHLPVEGFCPDFMPDLVSSGISRGSSLRCQQSSSRGEQVRKCREHPNMVAVLKERAEPNFAKAEHALDRPEDMLHPCADLRLQPVGLADPLVDPPIATKGLIGQILCH